MADYKGLIVPSGSPTGEGGILIIDNFKEIADNLYDLKNQQSVNTLESLKDLIPGTDGQTVLVRGYNSEDDKGAGIFYWDSSSSEDGDDGYTVIPNSSPDTGRWIRAYLPQTVSVSYFGAKGDGMTDDTNAIKFAIDFCPIGGTVFFPSPSVGYLVRGSGSEIFLIDKNISLVGENGENCKLIIAEDVPNTRDVIRIAVPGPCFFQRIQNLHITSADVETPLARHAINIDVTTDGAYQSNMFIEGNYLNSTNGYSVYFDNDDGGGGYANLDGMFCSQIKKNLILSGMSLLHFGDSNVIAENTFGHVGPIYLGTYRTAILMTQVPGAARCIIQNNNNSAFGGFVRATSCSQLVIEGNQAEQGEEVDLGIQPESAVVALVSCNNPRIIGNNFSPHGALDRADWGIYLDSCTDVTIDQNSISPGVMGVIKVTSTCERVRIGDNALNETTIDDAGLFSMRNGAWQRVYVTVVDDDTTLTSRHVGSTVFCSPASPAANYAITLPAASSCLHKTIIISIPVYNYNLVTVSTGGSGTIDGLEERIMWANESAVLWSDGTDWHKTAGRSVPLSCRLIRTTSMAVPTATVWKIDMTDVDFDNSGLMTDLAFGRIKCVRGGLYQCQARTTFGALAASTIVQVRIHINSDVRAYDIRECVLGGYPSPEVTLTTTLLVDDLVYNYAFQTSGLDGNLYYDGDVQTQSLEVIELPQW